MLTHQAIWKAIDGMAAGKDWSLPDLAIRAGLDPTSLNPSKRHGPDGKPRWPSTETLAKLLCACDMSCQEFCVMMEAIAEQGSEALQ